MKKICLTIVVLVVLLGLASCSIIHTHNIVTYEAKNPTCTEVGYYSYEKCTECEYTTYEEIETLEHNLEYNALIEATCTKEGEKEYYYCWVCQNYFANEEGTQQISDESLVISKKEHIDENNNYICDYNCGEVLIAKETLQGIITNTLSSTKVTVKEWYIPASIRSSYYFDDNLLYMNEDEGQEEKYYYTENGVNYLLTKKGEWEKEISTDEVSYNLSFLFDEIYDLEITGNIWTWTCSHGAFTDENMFRYTNSLGVGVSLKLNEEGTLLDGIILFHENGSFTHEFVITYGKNEAIVTTLENIKK